MRTGAGETPIVRRNLTLRQREVAHLDSLRESLETWSDSEIVRQALRYLEEFVEDHAVGRKFVVVPPKGRNPHEITLAVLDDDLDSDLSVVRRNLIIHQSSVDRLESMKKLAGIRSDSEAIRMALKYTNILVDEARAGSRFFVDDGQKKMEVRLAGISPPRRPADNSIHTANQLKKVI